MYRSFAVTPGFTGHKDEIGHDHVRQFYKSESFFAISTHSCNFIFIHSGAKLVGVLKERHRQCF